jgi:hypothetical protein
MTRTQAEIVERIEARKDDDFFGFEIGDYIVRLDYDHAKPYLKDDVTREEWETTDLDPLQEAKEYVEFAFEKARGQRGISASRSLCHYIAWIWLSGDDAFAAEVLKMSSTDYAPYGIPVLKHICNKYGWEIPK